MKLKTISDEDSELYDDFRRDAVYYLRSEVPNAQGLTVLQYAARNGMADCVQVMLTEEDVFITQQVCSKQDICKNTGLL